MGGGEGDEGGEGVWGWSTGGVACFDNEDGVEIAGGNGWGGEKSRY